MDSDQQKNFQPNTHNGKFWSIVPLVCFLLVPIVGIFLFNPVVQADICGYPEKGFLVVSRGAETTVTFQVALAESRDQYRRGLMGCRRLSPGTGLLFIYPEAARRTFWMKNTPLELAIIFVSSRGYIRAIEKGSPNSTRRIHSPDGIQFVLEINHDEADQLAVGDRITLRPSPPESESGA